MEYTEFVMLIFSRAYGGRHWMCQQNKRVSYSGLQSLCVYTEVAALQVRHAAELGQCLCVLLGQVASVRPVDTTKPVFLMQATWSLGQDPAKYCFVHHNCP